MGDIKKVEAGDHQFNLIDIPQTNPYNHIKCIENNEQ